jgi:hypothetical protein
MDVDGFRKYGANEKDLNGSSRCLNHEKLYIFVEYLIFNMCVLSYQNT